MVVNAGLFSSTHIVNQSSASTVSAAILLLLLLRTSYKPHPQSPARRLKQSATVTIESHTHSNPTRDSLPPSAASSWEPAPSASGGHFAASSQSSPPTATTSIPESLHRLIPATRTRSELDQSASPDSSAPASLTDTEHARARKRQRIDSPLPPADVFLPAIDLSLQTTANPLTGMRVSDSNPYHSKLSPSPPGMSSSLANSSSSSSVSLSVPGPSNGHQYANGFSSSVTTNGSTSHNGTVAGNGIQKHARSIVKVNLPGTMLYEDSYVDREEFVRLVIQSLRDVGYIESAATLEAESGYMMEAPEVSEFRQYILDGLWPKAETALMRMGVRDDQALWEARFLLSRQKYLEHLEARRIADALQVLRTELAPLNVDPDQLHTLSSLILCPEPEDLRSRAGWDGASGTSRTQLLNSLQRYISSSVMIPQRRFSTLLHQARLYQRQRCIYHNSASNAFSLYTDHQCSENEFPRFTTTILEVHGDEVWNMEWSHDGRFLASASKDKTAIIWRLGSDSDESLQEWSTYHILREHEYPVGCLAWSIDDQTLLTTAENKIHMWNTNAGICTRKLERHTEPVTALAWLPDGSGFLSGGLDRQIFHWDAEGNLQDSWGPTAIRITDLAVASDLSRLVTIGMHQLPPLGPVNDATNGRGSQAGDGQAGGNGPAVPGSKQTENRLIVYNLATKQPELSIHLDGELTSVKVSRDSRYALINHAPDEVQMRDLNNGRLVRKFTGQKQGRHVIRSCFGGIDGNFVVSGSEGKSSSYCLVPILANMNAY
ncbi:hypothetical protein AX16_008819 [Volvariella volvacea WC 439]|nr:hypothetical protein AX16_008819 [Volvariella volvacea WC 439]